MKAWERATPLLGCNVDYHKPHAPLLFTPGSIDHILPAHLSMRTFKKYSKGDSALDYTEFNGRNTSYYDNPPGEKTRRIFLIGPGKTKQCIPLQQHAKF